VEYQLACEVDSKAEGALEEAAVVVAVEVAVEVAVAAEAVKEVRLAGLVAAAEAASVV